MDISLDDASVLLSSTLNPTKGLHTTSTTRIALRGPRRRSCTLHLYLTLPTQLFADTYELAHRRTSYTFERFGGGNLEAPVFAPGAGGPSGLLLDVIIPEGDDDEAGDALSIDIDVPLHARYGVPKAGDELIDEVELPPPEVFWACPRASSGGSREERVLQVPDAIYDVVELAPALKSAERTLVLIPHAESVRAQTLRVPVGDARDVALVETGTVVVVLVVFVYLLRTIIRASRARSGPNISGAAKKGS